MMSSALKSLEKMRANPRDWRIEDLKVVARRFGIEYRQRATSHVIFTTPQGEYLAGSGRSADTAGLHPTVRKAGGRCGEDAMKRKEVNNEHITNAELRIDEYPFTIRRLAEDEGTRYLIEYPDFSVCMSDGETPEEAIVNGKDALRGVLLTKLEFGHAIPEPGSAVRLSPELRKRLEKRAMTEGKSVESLMAAILKDGLTDREAA